MTHTLLTLFNIPGLAIFYPVQEFIGEILNASDSVSGIFELVLITLIIAIVFIIQIRVTFDYLEGFGSSKKKFFKYLLFVILILNI